MERYLQKEYKLYLENRPGFYTIMGIIGQGASTVAYLAEYQDFSGHISKHILKEFNPSYIELDRDEHGVINYSEKDKDRFDNGLERFKSGCDRQYEIRNYERMNNQTPPLEGPYDANNTAYLDVANYVGATFDQAISEMSIMDRMKTCLSITKLIQCYHNAGYLCLDIKPQNVFVLPETKELLQFIDYDSVFKKSEIDFGNSISYTKYWSAPEQLNPYRWSEVSEQSDIYTIGELIFWSVFGRHSDVSEHRAFSSYPYEESKYAAILSEKARKLFDELFHKTLRTYANHRYSSAKKVRDILSEIIDELKPEKIQIVNSQIFPKDFFVGRDTELKEIMQLLDKNSVVFISGMGGIGKSELVKQYIKRHGDKYKNILYWTYSENLEKMVCQDESVSISNFNRVKEETDHNYCWRKLRKIKELLKDDNLIVIDNLDVKVEDLEYPELWRYLLTFQGHFLITTRCNESDYKQIQIKELSAIESVKVIFSHYCPYETDQDIYVQEIIESVDRSTLTVELLAKHTRADFLSPEEMLNKLQLGGLGSFDNNKVSLLKDGISESASIKNHIEKVFFVASLTDDRKLLLARLAFMPTIGIKERAFTSFFQIDHDDLNWLINHGWIKYTDEKNKMLTVHPVIADVIIEKTKEDASIIQNIFETEYYRLKNNRINVGLSHNDGYLICTAIANSGRKYCSNIVSKYIVQYVEIFVESGWLDEKIAILNHAIKIYDLEVNKDIYYPERERAYLNYVNILFKLNYFDERIIKISKEHLEMAQKAKDWGMAAYWCFCLELGFHLGRDFKKINKYYNKAYKYYYKYVCSHIFNKNISMLSALEIGELYIKMAELDELMADWSPYRKYAVRSLSFSIFCRKNANHTENNDIQISIDEVKKKVVKYQYKEAREILQLVINNKTGITIAKYKVYELLAMINILLGNYSDAEDDLECCLDIGKQLGYSDVYSVRVELGRLYNLTNRINKSEEYNKQLLSELLDIYGKNKKDILADAYYNIGAMYFGKGDYKSSQEYLDMAIKTYEEENFFKSRKYNYIGRARCYERLADIYIEKGEIPKAVGLLKEALNKYDGMLGSEHPETKSCKDKIQIYE